MEAIPKFDIKSFVKSDIKFDISIKVTTWIGQQIQPCALRVLQNSQKRIANSLPELHALLYSLLTNKNVFGNKNFCFV